MVNILWAVIICVVMSQGASTMNVDESKETKKIEKENKMIFPGTKWCGFGNIASNPDDLGIYYVTDSCCREHDNCPDVIEAGQTKYNLTNKDSVRLSCDCDEKFRRCLTKADSLASYTVRKIYFNVQKKCFKYEYPIVRCETYYSGTKRCISYALDKTAPKRFQWFDLPLA